jgi:hypothetical protein
LLKPNQRTPARRISAWPHPSEHHRKLHQDIMRLIGEVVAAWAHIEDLMAQLLSIAAQCPLQSAIIMFYSLNSFSARLSMLKATVQHCAPDTADRALLLDVLTKLRSLATSRNELVHASYTFEYGSESASMMRKVVRSERKRPISFVKAQTGEIKTHLDFLYSATQFLGLCAADQEGLKVGARKWAAIFLNVDDDADPATA